MGYTITKTNVESYKVRHESGMYWADITIDVDGKRGRIQIASDFGTWQNYWGACGSSFKHFLTQLNIEYAADKFGADRYFDVNKTLLNFCGSIKEHLKNDWISPAQSSELLAQCLELEDFIHEQEFVCELRGKTQLMRFFDHCPDIQYDITPGFKKFWKMVWPVFVDTLKKEMQEAPSVQVCDATMPQQTSQSPDTNP